MFFFTKKYRRSLAGLLRHGMVLCASNNIHTVVKLASVPVEIRIGERANDPGVDYGSEGCLSERTRLGRSGCLSL
jgi:hypothetical protein